MSVIVKTECQSCEDIHQDELAAVVILGLKFVDGKPDFQIWQHDAPPELALEMLANALSHYSDLYENLLKTIARFLTESQLKEFLQKIDMEDSPK